MVKGKARRQASPGPLVLFSGALILVASFPLSYFLNNPVPLWCQIYALYFLFQRGAQDARTPLPAVIQNDRGVIGTVPLEGGCRGLDFSQALGGSKAG